MNLSPTQLHYFKRELVALELQKELDEWRRNPNLTAVLRGDDDQKTSFPFLCFIAQKFIVDFPLLKRGSHDEFWTKCQVFFDEFSKVKLDTYVPKQTSASQRRILMYKIQKMIVLALCATIRTVQSTESPSKPLQAEPENTGLAVTEQQLTVLESEDHYLEWMGFNGLDIDIVTVRQVTEKSKLREKAHAEFILCSVTPDEAEPVYVARRHGQFRKLCRDLRAEYPVEDVPGVPSKVGEHRKDPLYREKDRLLLRSFLRRVAADPVLAKSSQFRTFLSADPTTLTNEEKVDAEKRRTKDKAKLAEEEVFRDQVDLQMAELQKELSTLKRQVMQPGGLIEVFDKIKTTEKLSDLPTPLKTAFEWGRINFAFSLHTQFITSDRAAENVTHLKRTHTLMPYKAIAQLLKISNPFSMIKGVLDLFLAQPFGGKSLFQRIMLANMSDQIKDTQQDITELEAIIGDPGLCLRIKNAVETPLPNGQTVPRDTLDYSWLLEMLRNEDIEPRLTPTQIVQIAAGISDKASPESRAFIKNIYRLWTMYARKREHELLMTLMFQGNTGELAREIFAIFYQPLAEVYKAANIGDSINHLSAFIDDLLALLDSLDGLGVQNTTQPFIQLVQRHEDKFYEFVHNVHAKDTSHLFDELLNYSDNVFAFIAHGMNGRIDMDQVIATANVADRMDALQKDVEAVCEFHAQQKAQRLRRRRQKLLMNQSIDASTLDILPHQAEVVNVLNDLVDMETDFEDDDDDEAEDGVGSLAHELTLQPPKLTVLPDVVPAFVHHVALAMKQT